MSLTVLGCSDLEGVYDDPQRVARLAGVLASGATTPRSSSSRIARVNQVD